MDFILFFYLFGIVMFSEWFLKGVLSLKHKYRFRKYHKTTKLFKNRRAYIVVDYDFKLTQTIDMFKYKLSRNYLGVTISF